MSSENSTSSLHYVNTILDHEPDVIRFVAKVAARIAYNNFEWRFLTLVTFFSFDIVGVKTFTRSYGKSVSLQMGTNLIKNPVFIPQFVVFGENDTEVVSIISWLADSGFDNTGRYILTCTALNDTYCDENKVLNASSELKMFNVIFLRTSKTYKPLAFTFDPIVPGNCHNTKPIQLPLSATCQSKWCYLKLFPEKLENLHTCSIRVSTFDQPPFMYLPSNSSEPPSGSDYDIITLVLDILNGTLDIIPPAEGQGVGHFINDNWTGSMGDVYNKKVHLSLCSTPLTYRKYSNFQISFHYNHMDIVWVASLPPLRPPWEKLMNPLRSYVRATLLFVFVVIIGINSYSKTKNWKKIRRALNIAPPKSSLPFYSWLILLGLPMNRFPKKLALLSSVVLWIWFCFILRTAYQAGLIDSLKHKSYGDNFNQFREVLEAGRPYGGLEAYREYYVDSPEIYNNWILLTPEETFVTLTKISDDNINFVLAINRESVLEYLIYKNKVHVQIIPEKIVSSPTVMYYRKFSPLVPVMSHVLVISMEGGFTERLYKKYVSRVRDLFKRPHYSSETPLTLQHFTGSIIFLIFGWVLSTISFFFELIYYKYKEVKKRRNK